MVNVLDCNIIVGEFKLHSHYYIHYLIYSLKDKGVHTFPKGISLKVKAIVWLEFELAYYDSTYYSVGVQYISHNVMGTLFVIFMNKSK